MPVINVTSNIVKDALLDSVEMLVTISNKTYWETEGKYGDFEAYIYEASADGKGPVGRALAKGTIEKKDITELDIPYTIMMRSTTDGSQVILKPGKQYVLLRTQNPRTVDIPGDASSNLHYRWPTSNSLGVTGEQYGKVNATDISDISSFAPENLGVGWMMVHTDKDSGGKATVDYSWENPKGGFGIGHQGEENRYQTFTMPADSVFSVVDGLANEGESWSTEGSGEVNAITLSFGKNKEFDTINLYFEEGYVPSKVTLKAGESVLAETSILNQGFNRISFNKATSDKLSIEPTPGPSATGAPAPTKTETIEDGSSVATTTITTVSADGKVTGETILTEVADKKTGSSMKAQVKKDSLGKITKSEANVQSGVAQVK